MSGHRMNLGLKSPVTSSYTFDIPDPTIALVFYHLYSIGDTPYLFRCSVVLSMVDKA